MPPSLKNLVQSLLKEAKEDEKESGEDSLDAQIDKYLANYEAEAKNSKNEALDFRMMTRRFLIEAGEDEEGGDKKAEKSEKPEKLTAEDLDVNSFVVDVMRLVDNYDNLLEVQNTILRRAANFLVDSYETDVVNAFKEELLDSYGIEIGKSKSEKEDEFEAPKAGAAGPAGGGGA